MRRAKANERAYGGPRSATAIPVFENGTLTDSELMNRSKRRIDDRLGRSRPFILCIGMTETLVAGLITVKRRD